MKVKVDKDKCSGCGTCAATCDQVFELPDGEDVAKVIVDVVPPEAEDEVREAADMCPDDAITIEE